MIRWCDEEANLPTMKFNLCSFCEAATSQHITCHMLGDPLLVPFHQVFMHRAELTDGDTRFRTNGFSFCYGRPRVPLASATKTFTRYTRG